MPSQPTARLRFICLALPEAVEKEAWGDPTFRPPYVGHKGWIGMRLDRKPDWDEVTKVVRRSYRLTAPKKLAALVGDETARHARSSR